MRSIHRKIIRDLLQMRGMVVVISLMIISGVATFVTLLSTLDSLKQTQQEYYRDYHFSHLFASLKRAPNRLSEELRDIPGIGRLETRIAAGATVQISGVDGPVQGYFLSIPDEGDPELNRLYIREGSMPAPYSPNEVVVGDAFAEANGLRPGDRFTTVINGRLHPLEVAGIGLSPEFIFQGNPASIIPDFEKFGIFWMRRSQLEAAYDMQGAFNNLVATTTWQANEAEILRRIDEELEPYGGLGATGREDQQSHFYITEELNQLSGMATIIPMIFLGVAAFLLSIVIGRLVKTQQGQIAILKAFGYTNLEIGLHYVWMVSVIVLLGLLAGVAFGVYLGGLMSDLYAQYYKFPFLRYELNAPVLLAAAGVSFGSAYLGVFVSVRKAVRLSPAEGMRPEPPQIFKRNLLERFSLIRRLDVPSKMILRQLSRHRLKALFSVIGIAFALALVMIGRMSNDSVHLAVEQEFRQAQPNDLSVVLDQPVSDQMIFELQRIPGVHAGEPYRTLPVRMRHEHRSHLTSIQAFPKEARLRRLLDSDGNRVAMPASGILLTEKLGEMLALSPGDTIRVELLENSRRTLEIPVAGFMNQFFGLGSYMSLDELNRLVPEKGLASGAYLLADRHREEEIIREIAERPMVANITSNQTIIEIFYDSTAQTWLIMAFIVSLFAGATAFSVVYNNARISLSERSRDLASLRVLGFTRAEIAFILLGELWILVLIAIPVGMVLGTGLTAFIIWSLQTEMYRIPMNITSTTYALGTLTVLVSTVLSAWVIRRMLNRLDLIGVLKTRE